MRRLIIGLAVAGALAAAAPVQAADSSNFRVCKPSRYGTGLGVLANKNTSCAFARQVDIAAARSGGRYVIYVVSPVTHKQIRMRRTGCGCSSDPWRPIIYRGGNHAAVAIAP